MSDPADLCRRENRAAAARAHLAQEKQIADTDVAERKVGKMAMITHLEECLKELRQHDENVRAKHGGKMPDWRTERPDGELWSFSRALNLGTAKSLGYVTPFRAPETYATEESITQIATFKKIHSGKEDPNSMLAIAVTTGLDNLVRANILTNSVFVNQS